MSTTTTPVWTDNVSVLALQTLARNATVRGTIDLRSKFGAWLMAKIGRGGTTALTNGVDILFRRTINNGGEWHQAATPAIRTSLTAALSTTAAAAGNNAGVSTLTVASSASFLAGDIILISDGIAGATEFARVARVTDGTHLLLDDVTKFAHNDVSHTVRTQGEAWSVWLDGGALWEVIFDYGDDSAGESVTLEVLAQTLDSYSAA